MKSRRIALVSIDPTWEDPSGDFTPFTYGVRKLQAAIVAGGDDVEVKVIDLRSRDPEVFFEAIVDFRPTLVGASLFLWSIGPFEELAARIRAWDPEVRIVVGGPHARASVFAMPRYHGLRSVVDAAVTGEGEAIIQTLARNHLDDDWLQTPGLLVPHALGWRSTGELARVDLDAHPSPYELDLAPRGFTGYLETFRGCPIHCSFCQWGEQAADRVFSVEALTRHLEGLARAEVPNVFNLDAAFNLSPRGFRNLREAEAATGVLAKTTVHGHLYPTLLREDHLAFLDSFGRAQVAIGVQSFDPVLLKKLGRPFDVARFERVLGDLRGHFPIELELMLGLPGDSPEGFRRTFHRAMEIADTVKVFWTLILPDALLDRAGDDALRFDPDTWLIQSCTGWTLEQLHAELAYVKDVASRHERAVIADFWAGFQLRRDDTPARHQPVHEVRLPTAIHRSLDLETADAVLRVLDAHALGPESLEASIRVDGNTTRGGRMMVERVDAEIARALLAALGIEESRAANRLLDALPEGHTLIGGWDERMAKLYLNLSDASDAIRAQAARAMGLEGAPHVIGLNLGASGEQLKVYEQLDALPPEAPEALRAWAREFPIAGAMRSFDIGDGERHLRAIFATPRDGAGDLESLPGYDAQAARRAWPFEPGCLRSVGFSADGASWTAYAKPFEASTVVHSVEPAHIIRSADVELGLFLEPASAERAYARTDTHALSYRVREGAPSREAIEAVMAWALREVRASEASVVHLSGAPEGWHAV